MNLVDFLEARIAERGAQLQGRDVKQDGSAGPGVPRSRQTLNEALLSECAEKRSIVAAWKASAAAEGTTDPAQSGGADSCPTLDATNSCRRLPGPRAYHEEWSVRH